jgi:hypothetical protein
MTHLIQRSLVLLALGLAVAGCTSAADIAARDQERCANRGFAPHSDLYANCLLQLDGERSARTEQRRRENLEKTFDPSSNTPGR